ncbi:MAG TPA: polyphosphate kinase 1 [Solirubrobacterales bacterium]|jgi:polyphosphate kinase|nr:polyphosphate kinase 1 [Solirubrobacterales bacterium]
MTEETLQTPRRAARSGDGEVAVTPSEPPSGGPDGVIDLEETSLYFNRELSWLDFNERVLQLAEDPDVPLLERLRFCAIYEDNLDEFYMVRIAGLHDQLEANNDARGADGIAPGDVIHRVRERAMTLRKRLYHCFADVLSPALAEQGIRVLRLADADGGEREEVERLFKQQVFPALTPLVIGRGRPFPYISNLSLSIAVLLRNPEKDEEVVARVKVPKELLRRFLSIGDGGVTFVPLEDVIAANLDDLFPGMEIVHHSLFRVTRDTDYDVNDEAADLMQAVEEEVRRRRFGEVVRLEVSDDMEPGLRGTLIDALKISEEQVYDVPGLLGLDDLEDVVGVPGKRELRYPTWKGVTPPELQQGKTHREVDVFGAMRDGDILVHHPYDSFTSSVERFVRQAVEDPDVLAIKQTVYRTSADSPLVPGLIEATERGKQAVSLVELKARFDESANIQWARSLEEAGVHVVYGIPGLKTHVKCVLIARREGDGVRNYVHIGTGNYNPKTARLYTDAGLFTADEQIGADIAEMFNYLTGYARPKRYRKVAVAPFTLKEEVVGEIERAIEAHSPERPSRIRMKMNSLLDPSCIRALYRASQAGMQVDLNVRGICALRPGVPGVSENIRVVSIVGRFLEHSRIYSFERENEQRIYIGSADLMPRNLYNRVELLSPVEGSAQREQLDDVLDRAFADNTNSWELDSDGSWRRLSPDGEEPRNLQQELMKLHAARSETAAAAAV